MAVHARRYRDKPSHPIPVWNGVLEHRKRIDGAIWLFLWLLDAVTNEKDDIGLVHGGAPVKVATIAQTLEFDEWTVRQHFKKLEEGGYVKRRRTPYGYVVYVIKSRKFGIWHGHKRSELIEQEIGAASLKRSWERPRNKEDAARNAAITQQAAAAPEDSVWGFLKIQPCGPLEFQSLLESRWSSRNGERATVLIAECVDGWEAAHREKPRGTAPLFRALFRLRATEKESKSQDSNSGIHVLTPEEIPV
jgi:hypothetical protein